MNDLYPFVESATKNYSNDTANRLLQHLAQNPGAPNSPQFSCSVNQEYVIKRLITASLARDSDIKFNSFMALNLVLEKIQEVKGTINVKKVIEFVIGQSDIKKNCGGKATQIQAYIIGKILIAKAFKSLFKDQIEIINHLIDLLKEYPGYEQQLIELVYELTHGKKAQLAFSKISPQSKEGFVLFTILRSQLKGVQPELNQAVLEEVLAEAIPQYPKRSICIQHLGGHVSKFVENPAVFLEEKFIQALGNEEESLDVKKLLYTLQLLEAHLSATTITKVNVWNVVTPGLIGSWLSQLKVQNKFIRKQAETIRLVFEPNHDLAFDILKQLHNSRVNLSNINIKHPLFPLLQAVQPDIYFNYLLSLCKPETESNQIEQDALPVPVNQFQVFITLAHKDLPAESVAKAIQFFSNNYHQSKNDTNLQILISIFNSLLPHSHKKKPTLLLKPSLVLTKLHIEELELGEGQVQLKQALKDIRAQFKEHKNESNPILVSYLNFLLSVGFYLIIYPEELEIYSDLQLALQDIKAKFINQEEGIVPKKKRKLNPQEQKNKPIHILVDIFISLLTKSPQFLRTSINNLFEQIMPFLDSQALSHLLEVLQRPDQEYIQDYQNQ